LFYPLFYPCSTPVLPLFYPVVLPVQACLELTRLRWLSFSSQASQATLPLEGVELGSVLVVSVSILFIVLFSIHLFYFKCI
jgi:hypothetical protein